ncbi:MAG: hypothetical protein QM784_11475 [Polyangiaceae bacterium]
MTRNTVRPEFASAKWFLDGDGTRARRRGGERAIPFLGHLGVSYWGNSPLGKA